MVTFIRLLSYRPGNSSPGNAERQVYGDVLKGKERKCLGSEKFKVRN